MPKSPISAQEREQFLRDILTAAGPGGLPETEVSAACDAFIGMVISGGIIDGWRNGHISLAWDINNQDFTIALKENN